MTMASAQNGALAGAQILVVEDEFVIAMQLQSMFEEEGAEVLGPYHTLPDALAHAETDDITAASLDFHLGRDTAADIASLLERRQVPFVFYSVQTGDPALERWRHIPLIQKPAASMLVQALAALVHTRVSEDAQ